VKILSVFMIFLFLASFIIAIYLLDAFDHRWTYLVKNSSATIGTFHTW
jgi:hypothetical protein